MSFGLEIKQELVRVQSRRRCCRVAELAALFRFGAGYGTVGPQVSLVLESELPGITRKAVRQLADLFGLRPEVEIARRSALRKGRFYRLRLTGEDLLTQILDEMGLEFVSEKGESPVAPRILRQPCCSNGYLRGAYLATGSLTHPLKSYHLEMVFRRIDQAREIGSMLSEAGVEPHFFSRKGRQVLYLKSGEAITDFLALVGGFGAKFRWEEMRIRRELRGTVNRLVNCDTANVAKAVDAAMRQLEAIQAIERLAGLGVLTGSLAGVAELRQTYPHASLAELGELSDPPLSKSAVSHRLRRLLAIAAGLEKSRDGNFKSSERPRAIRRGNQQ